MPSPIRTGLLSYGLSGRIFHAPFLTAHPGFELQAVVERSQKKAATDHPGIISYDSVDDLLTDPLLELVVVNTPNFTHYGFAAAALKAGKQVLVEKAFTTIPEEAAALFTLGRQQGLCVLPYQNRRYDTDLQSVAQVLRSGRLGRLVEAHLRFDRYRYAIGPKAAKETPVPGSGLLYDLGPHLVDAAIFLFGLPHHWTTTTGRFRPGTQVDDYAHIHLRYEEDLQVFLTTSLLVPDPQPAFVLHGTKGSYVKHRTDRQEAQLLAGLQPDDPLFGTEAPGREGILTTIQEDGTTVREMVPATTSSYLQLFEAAYRTIREGTPYPVTEEAIMMQLRILSTPEIGAE